MEKFSDMELRRSSETVVLYHKDCMDGLASAFIANEYMEFVERSCTCIPVQYGMDLYQILTDYDKLHDNCEIIFVDFSAKRDILLKIANEVNFIQIIDHHKTAQADLLDIEKESDKINAYFDMNHSGAVLTYKFFRERCQTENFLRLPPPARIFFDYIQDRDLWTWALENSEEVSEFLRLQVIPNDIEYFGNLLRDIEIDEAQRKGELLIKYRNKQVDSKVKKVKRIVIGNIEVHAVNATENISELGNAICKQYHTPSLMYFITEENEVVFSFRSMDHLPDASVIATFFGGGGHRNACGAGKLSINILASVLNNEFCETKLTPVNKNQLSLDIG